MSKFQDKMNRWITSGLFKETAQRPDYVIWTLREARELYIESNDPTGYLFSTTCLGGYQHWLAIKASPTLEHHIAAWEEELEVKLRSESLMKMQVVAQTDKGYQAAKYLAEGGWKPKQTGRPTREKIKTESRIQSKIYDEFGLKAVK